MVGVWIGIDALVVVHAVAMNTQNGATRKMEFRRGCDAVWLDYFAGDCDEVGVV